MTEAEWLACRYPEPLVEFLRGPSVIWMRGVLGRQIPIETFPEQRGSERQRRLLAVALCRRYWHLLDEAHCRKLADVGDNLSSQFSPSRVPLDSCQKAIELAELFADGHVYKERLQAAQDATDLFHYPANDYAACYVEGRGPYDHELIASGDAAYAVYYACQRDIDFSTVGAVIRQLRNAEDHLLKARPEVPNMKESTVQANLIRDIFGNPFRAVIFLPEWRTDTALALARQMYESRDFSAMPILADALQDAGCDSEEMLGHCRATSETHVRGCWVVDLVLGKE